MKQNHLNEIQKFLFDGAEIYLHGSRSKIPEEEIPEGTDWDYAVDYLYLDQIYRAQELGWEECVDKSYLDSNSSVVLEKEIDGDKVQVSARQSLHTFKKVWEELAPEKYREFWKQENNVEIKDYLESRYSRIDNWIEEIPF